MSPTIEPIIVKIVINKILFNEIVSISLGVHTFLFVTQLRIDKIVVVVIGLRKQSWSAHTSSSLQS